MKGTDLRKVPVSNNLMQAVETFVGHYFKNDCREADSICEVPDCSLVNLSSKKLWDILRLATQQRCKMDIDFLEDVVTELSIRSEFDFLPLLVVHEEL